MRAFLKEKGGKEKKERKAKVQLSPSSSKPIKHKLVELIRGREREKKRFGKKGGRRVRVRKNRRILGTDSGHRREDEGERKKPGGGKIGRGGY